MTKNVFEDGVGNFVELPCIPQEELAQQVAQLLDSRLLYVQIDAAFPVGAESSFEQQEGEA